MKNMCTKSRIRHRLILTVSQTTNFIDSFKLKGFADDNFKFDKNSRKFSKWVENTGKSRNCSLRAISPFPSVSKDVYYRHVKTRACLGKGFKNGC